MRWVVPALVVLILLPAAAAQPTPRDRLLDDFLSFGDDELFEEFVSLLVVREAAAARLQTAGPNEMSDAESGALFDLMVYLEQFERAHEDRDGVPSDLIASDLFELRALHSDARAFSGPNLDVLRAPLTVATEELLRSYVVRAEGLAQPGTVVRTSLRIDILEAAAGAAEAANDVVAFARISAQLGEERERYESQVVWAYTQLDRAGRLHDDRLVYHSFHPTLPWYYANLERHGPRVEQAEAFLRANGEDDGAEVASQSVQELSDAAGRVRLALFANLAIVLAGSLGIGWWASRRLSRWAQDTRRTRGGDELIRGLAR